jgi:uncharacterized protein
MKNLYPLIKVLEVDGDVYLYDARQKLIAEIEKKDFMCDEELSIKHSIIEKYAKRGYFQKGIFKKVVPEDSELSNLVEYQLSCYFPRKFTIEVTEACNLGCNYCLFARKDPITRKHSFRNINIETAKKAIDFYFNLYTSLLMKISVSKREKLISVCPPKLSWWGGEPLLAFDIIKESKQYFDSLNWEKFGIKSDQLNYLIVSNLTIINEDILEFLVKNNVLLHVSLDGNRKEHDANRVFSEKKGTFDIVMQNLMHLIEKYPTYSKKRIIIQSVAAENIDIKKSYDFMAKRLKINSPDRLITKYLVYDQKKEKQFFSDIQIKMQNEVLEIESMNKMLEILSERQGNDFVEYLQHNYDFLKEFENLFLLEKKLVFENPSNNYYLNSFSCPIGADSIFVAVNGDFHMCMKSDYSFPIGNVHNGLDKNAIEDLYASHLSCFREKCKNCWAISLCQICPAQTLHEKEFCAPTDKDCEIIRKGASIALKKYIIFSKNEIIYNQVKNFFDNQKSNGYTLDTGPININNLNL